MKYPPSWEQWEALAEDLQRAAEAIAAAFKPIIAQVQELVEDLLRITSQQPTIKPPQPKESPWRDARAEARRQRSLDAALSGTRVIWHRRTMKGRRGSRK